VLQKRRIQSCDISGRNLARDQHFRSKKRPGVILVKQNKKKQKNIKTLDCNVLVYTLHHTFFNTRLLVPFLEHFRRLMEDSQDSLSPVLHLTIQVFF